jgi:hypothetical protein
VLGNDIEYVLETTGSRRPPRRTIRVWRTVLVRRTVRIDEWTVDAPRAAGAAAAAWRWIAGTVRWGN